MKTLIKNLCGKLENWGIDPNILAKAVCMFLLLLTLAGLITAFPILAIVLIAIICVLIIGIYSMIE